MEIDANKITRLEVIDEEGRKYTKWNCKIQPMVQDNGRTLKIFVQYDKNQSMLKELEEDE